jgi:hypothetical protein
VSAPFDSRGLGLGIGESASVMDANEPLHPSRGLGWHHDAWLVDRVAPATTGFGSTMSPAKVAGTSGDPGIPARLTSTQGSRRFER